MVHLRLLFAGTILCLLSLPATATCTQQESEEQLREVIPGIAALRAKDRTKADQMQRRFDYAFEPILEVTMDPDQSKRKWENFCKTLADLLAELRK